MIENEKLIERNENGEITKIIIPKHKVIELYNEVIIPYLWKDRQLKQKSKE